MATRLAGTFFALLSAFPQFLSLSARLRVIVTPASTPYIGKRSLFWASMTCLGIVGIVATGILSGPEPVRHTPFVGCPGNVKQLGTSLQIYLNDNDNSFPTDDWHLASLPYTRNEDLYTCNTLKGKGLRWGYAMNSSFAGKKIAAGTDGSKSVLMFEIDALGPGVIANLGAIAQPRHGKAVVVGRLDSSIKTLPPDEILTEYGP